MGEASFRLFGTNGVQETTENETVTVVGLRCRQNLKFKNFTSLFGILRQKIAPNCVLHVQHDYFPHLFATLSWLFPSSFLKLTIIENNLRKTSVVIFPSVDQEKVKEKESRKTQTFKKDDDKKKKLMQAEVQVCSVLLLE